MATFEIIREQEAAGGWMFDAHIVDASGGLHPRVMTLSWADYNLWSRDGGDPPVVVAEAVLGFLLQTAGLASLKPRFDASLARRISPEADETIPSRIVNRLP